MDKNKFVLWHPESDSYMYAHSEDERDVLCADGEVNDVTGIKHHEEQAELQLGPWQIDANEQEDTRLILESGSIETTEGTLLISGDSVEIPQHIYDKYAEEIDELEKEEDWFFTFGSGHAHPYGYVHIYGTFGAAREEMVRRYGQKWAFQYDAKGFEGQIARFGLYEVKE